MSSPPPDELSVRLSVPFDYPVHFTRGAFDPSNGLLAAVFDRRREGRRHRVSAWIDAGVAQARPGLQEALVAYFRGRSSALELSAPPRLLPGGEAAKRDWKVIEHILAELQVDRIDRQSFVLAIGGGSFLDAVGLAATLFHRGVRLVRMPSTVLAQDDAGVGVKNGVDLGGVKNLVGAFAPPFAVVNDLDLLDTLPQVHWLGGVAEAFKVAMIKDRAMFERLCEKAEAIAARDPAVMEAVVRETALHHVRHIAACGDPFETGTARPLDFGHWSAHKLESLSGFRVTHGEAVAFGITLDSYYAMRKGLIDAEDFERLRAAISRCGFPPWHPEAGSRSADGGLRLLEGLREFREHLGGQLTITLPHPLGAKVEVHEVDLAIVEEGLRALENAPYIASRSAGRLGGIE